MAETIPDYSAAQTPTFREICDHLAMHINSHLPRANGKIWHGGPVWFLDGNPVVGYWVRKSGVQLLFWSGQSFDEPGLKPEGKFKAAHVQYANALEIDVTSLARWLAKAATIQWDYKNIVKRRGILEKIGDW
jgi:hypothetical protein